MKPIDAKSLLIGFLLCAVGFLTIGATYKDLVKTGVFDNVPPPTTFNIPTEIRDNNGYGKYQAFEPGRIIDTSTGQMWSYYPANYTETARWQETIKPNDFRIKKEGN